MVAIAVPVLVLVDLMADDEDFLQSYCVIIWY